MQQFQALTHSPRSSSPSQVSQSNRSSSSASSETATLPTPPQSPVTHHDMKEHSDSHDTHSKKAMEHEKFVNCLTNAILKTRYVFCQNVTNFVYWKDATV